MLSRLITRREQFVVVFLAAAAIIGAVALYVSGTRDAALTDALVVDSRPETREDPVAGEGIYEGAEVDSLVEPIRDEVTVSLVGAVGRPGVYTLDAGSRIQDLVGSAGGLLRSADTSDVNLAAKLIDGTTLIIPRKAVRDDAGIDSESESADFGNIPEYTIRAN